MEYEFYIYPYPEGYDQFVAECCELEELFWKELFESYICDFNEEKFNFDF